MSNTNISSVREMVREMEMGPRVLSSNDADAHTHTPTGRLLEERQNTQIRTQTPLKATTTSPTLTTPSTTMDSSGHVSICNVTPNDEISHISSMSCNSTTDGNEHQHDHDHGGAEDRWNERHSMHGHGYGSNDNTNLSVHDFAVASSPVACVSASASIEFDINSPSDALLGITSNPNTSNDFHSNALNDISIDRYGLRLALEDDDNDDIDNHNINEHEHEPSDDELMHRNQLLEEEGEFLRSTNTTPSIHDPSTSSIGMVVDADADENGEILNNISPPHPQDQKVIIESQRGELKRYDGILKEYRNSMREKNDSLRSMEEQINELKRCQSQSTVGETETSSQQVQKDENMRATLSALQSEIRSNHQIISSLTCENNTYRRREVSHCQTIEHYEREIADIKIKAENKSKTREKGFEFRKLEEELRRQTHFSESMMKEINVLEEHDSHNQIQVAELGQEILRLERQCESLEGENETLQKLLSTSREAGLNRSLESCNGDGVDSSVNLNVNTNVNDSHSHLDGSFINVNENASYRSSDDDGRYMNTIVQESISNELERTKKSEKQLRQQLTELCQDENKKDIIMESLSESQQEVIVYLNGEVQELRSQLENERKKWKSQVEEMKNAEERIQVLEQESKLAVEESIAKGKLLDTTRQDLSMRSGENACLKDEIVELEEKSTRVHDLESSFLTLDNEHKALKKNYAEFRSQVQGHTGIQHQHQQPTAPPVINRTPRRASSSGLKQSPSCSSRLSERSNKVSGSPCSSRASVCIYDNFLEDGECLNLSNIDLGGKDTVHDTGTEVEVQADYRSSENDASHRKFSVLKKALKQSYERKQREMEENLEKKQSEIERLTLNLERQRLSYQEQQDEIQEIEVRRIYHEVEADQELESLRISLKDRDIALEKLKWKLQEVQKDDAENIHPWRKGVTGISNVLIDSVGRSIELFESMSFGQDDPGEEYEYDMSSRSDKLMSSKSFG